ncbi:hypothetical protein IPA_08380 [Ignicoccus pacificus DSM 13166]|uniref:Uncharacterized protein n=1 Tax=Ignicoccus pacificus DSM 13166 TaxID=940294 RepID=A0A977KBW6_9CREN|nr:hypothetical protein IPA_08380 [Ignicoccus pacificus DSM 13166]
MKDEFIPSETNPLDLTFPHERVVEENEDLFNQREEWGRKGS